jgi:ribosome biogenesis GTPase
LSKTRRSLSDSDFDIADVDVPPVLEGLVVDGSGGIYRIETPEGTLRCEIRGRLRKHLSYAQTSNTPSRNSVQRVKVHSHDPVAVGDRVRVLITGRGTGMIEEIVARAGGAFARRDSEAGQ